MIESIKAFILTFVRNAGQRSRAGQADRLTVMAALLVRVATVRDELSDLRRAELHTILSSRYGFDRVAATQLVFEAEAIARSAVDLYGFTRKLNDLVDDEERRRIVQMMWEIVYADGKVNEFEENIIWRAADLLGVSSRQRVELRQKIAADTAALNPA